MITSLTRIYKAAATAALTGLVTAGCSWLNPQRVEVKPAVTTSPRSYGGTTAQPGASPAAAGTSGSFRSGY